MSRKVGRFLAVGWPPQPMVVPQLSSLQPVMMNPPPKVGTGLFKHSGVDKVR